MSKIKLVHFTSSLKIGGAEKVLFDLVTHLDAHKYEQAVVYIHDGPYRQKLSDAGIPTYQVRGVLFQYDPWLLFRLWRLLRTLKPDVLHTLLWSANLCGRIVARMLNIHCVCALHNNYQQNGMVRTLLDRCTRKTATTMVAVSQEVAQSATQCAWVPAHKIQVIQNGIDLAAVQQGAVSRESLGLLPAHFIIGAVGRFHPVKRFDLLLRTFAQVVASHSYTRLVLVGMGELEDALRAQADTLGIAELVVFVIGQPAQRYYPIFDGFVQTSAQEGISIALLEAMAAAVPCVAMSVGSGHSVIIHEHNGLVIDSSDEPGLVEALGRLIKDEKLRARLGQQARVTVQRQFALDNMIKSYDLLFEHKGKALN